MAPVLQIVDEVEHRVIELDWTDLDDLPDLTYGPPAGARSRRASVADTAIDFLTELRRLNQSYAIA